MDMHDGWATTARLRQAGYSQRAIQNHLSRGRLVRVSRGVFITTPAAEPNRESDRFAQQRREYLARANALVNAFPEAYLTGASACVALGLPVHTLPARVHISRQRRVRTSREELVAHRPWEHAVLEQDGMRVQEPAAAVIEVAAHGRLPDGLIPADAALRAGLFTQAHALLDRFGQRQGALTARRVMELADGRRESPLESLVFLQALGAGFTLEPQVTIRTAEGGWIARVDFVVRNSLVIVEADGIGKYQGHRDFRDERVRHNLIEEQGWVVVRVTHEDLQLGRFVPRLRAAVARAPETGHLDVGHGLVQPGGR